MHRDRTSFESWYAIHTYSQQTDTVIELIESLFGSHVKFIFFRKEMIHKKNDRYEKVILPLFPGYIFLSENVEMVINRVRAHFPHIYVRVVSFGGRPEKVNPAEMRLLIKGADESGLIPLSTINCYGDKILITDGPLMNMNGRVLFINKKKRKAKVQVELFNKTMEISLGLDIIEHPERILHAERRLTAV